MHDARVSTNLHRYMYFETSISFIYIFVLFSYAGDSRLTDVSVLIRSSTNWITFNCFITERFSYLDKVDVFRRNFYNAEILLSSNFAEILYYNIRYKNSREKLTILKNSTVTSLQVTSPSLPSPRMFSCKCYVIKITNISNSSHTEDKFADFKSEIPNASGPPRENLTWIIAAVLVYSSLTVIQRFKRTQYRHLKLKCKKSRNCNYVLAQCASSPNCSFCGKTRPDNSENVATQKTSYIQSRTSSHEDSPQLSSLNDGDDELDSDASSRSNFPSSDNGCMMFDYQFDVNDLFLMGKKAGDKRSFESVHFEITETALYDEQCALHEVQENRNDVQHFTTRYQPQEFGEECCSMVEPSRPRCVPLDNLTNLKDSASDGCLENQSTRETGVENETKVDNNVMQCACACGRTAMLDPGRKTCKNAYLFSNIAD